VTPDQREVCPLSRQDNVVAESARGNPIRCSSLGTLYHSTPIRPITGRHSLPPSSFTCCPVGAPCGLLSLDPNGYGAGETTGLPRSANVTEWIGRICTPVAQHLRRRSSRPPDLATYLLVQACQQLTLVLGDDAYDALPGLPLPLNPGPRSPTAGDRSYGSRFGCPPEETRPHIGGGYVVPALSSQPV